MVGASPHHAPRCISSRSGALRSGRLGRAHYEAAECAALALPFHRAALRSSSQVVSESGVFFLLPAARQCTARRNLISEIE